MMNEKLVQFLGGSNFSMKLGEKIMSSEPHEASWAAFLCPPLWAGYRKQWKIFFIYTIGMLVAAAIAIFFQIGWIVPVTSVCLSILIGFKSIPILRQHYVDWQKGMAGDARPSYLLAIVSLIGYSAIYNSMTTAFVWIALTYNP